MTTLVNEVYQFWKMDQGLGPSIVRLAAAFLLALLAPFYLFTLLSSINFWNEYIVVYST